MTTDPARPRDDDAVRLFAFKVWSYKQGEVVSLMVHLGDRLGLYREMAGAGPLTAGDLAERTGLKERWLLEWLRGQAAAGLLESVDGERFELTAEGAAVLADEESSIWYAAGAFQGSVVPPEVLERLAAAFRTGTGLTYDDLGPAAAETAERMLGPWTRLSLVPTILPAIGGVPERLERGARVADLGCGSGVALLTMARAFPSSRFVGYDLSRHAIDRARAAASAEGLDNLTFSVGGEDALGSERDLDLVVTFDCLHDMTHPAAAAAAVRRSLAGDGVWLVKEIRAGASWEEKLRNPLLAMMYGTSVATCMSSGLSRPGGAGLGTLGLDRTRLEELCTEAGFSTVTVHDFDDPANLYYEVRP